MLAYKTLFALWKTRELVTVQLPWAYFDTMIIKGVSFTQNAESKEITDISVTLKEMRFAEIKTVNFDQNILPPASEVQEAPEEEGGLVGEEEKDLSSSAFRGLEKGKDFLNRPYVCDCRAGG